jgi:hypothetical protein
MYQRLLRMPSKTCIYYLVLTILVSLLISSLQMTVSFFFMMDEFARDYDSYFPPMQISNYELSVPGDMPIVHISDDFEIIVDTTGKRSELDNLIAQGIILQKDKVLVFQDSSQPREMSYRMVGLEDLTIDSKAIRDSRWLLTIMFFVIGGGVRIVWSGLSKVFEVFMAFLFVGLFADFARRPLSNEYRLNIATTALAPPIFIETIQELFQMHFSGFFNLYIVVYAFFLIIGTRSLLSKIPPKEQ